MMKKIKIINTNDFDITSYKNIKYYANKYSNNKQQYSHLLSIYNLNNFFII